MITLPAFLLLLIFGLVFLVELIMMGVLLFQGYRFGRYDKLTVTVNTLFTTAAVAIVVFTFIMLAPVDWSTSFKMELQVPGLPSGNTLLLPNDTNSLNNIVNSQ